MTIQLIYSRYYQRYVKDFDTVREAAQFAESQQDAGYLYALQIEEDGKVVWTRVGQHPDRAITELEKLAGRK